MDEENKAFTRWYEQDPVVAECFKIMEQLDDRKKRQTATFLMNEIISRPPFSEMIPDDIFKLATGEEQKRRWYDYDEVSRIFAELLRHSPDETKKEIAIKAITFIQDLP
ncbi:MAG: hypothetical protein WCG23_10805 [bacterium]